MSITGKPFSVQNPSGLTIRGTAYLAVGDTPRPTVIVSHGFNGCYADLLSRAETFTCAGIHCYLFDFCGGGVHGTSDGKLSEMMTIPSECADLETVAAYVRAQPDTDQRNLYLMGESQGGLISVLVSQKEPSAYRGIILWYPALMIPQHSAERTQQGSRTVFGITLSPDFDRLAAALDPWCGMPAFDGDVLLIQGDSDPVVPMAISEKAANLFPHASLLVLPGAMHGFSGNDLRHALDAGAAFIQKTAV